MIVYPNSLNLSAAVSMRNPRIGYQTYTFARDLTNVVVSSEAVGMPRDAPLHPDTGEMWQPLTLPATWQLDLGVLQGIDYVGLVGSMGTSRSQVAVYVGEDTDFDARMSLPGIAGNYASTPDSGIPDVIGDIDIRVKVSAVDWTPTGNPYLVAKNGFTTGGGYNFRLLSGGALQIGWSNGTSAFTVASSGHGFVDGSTHWVRVTLDVDNGAAGRDIKFFTSVDGIVWVQLGSTTTTAGVTTIGVNANPLAIGMFHDGASDPHNGNIYYADVRNAIDASVPVIKFDPASGLTDAASFVSSTSETWTINRTGTSQSRLINPRFGGADIAPTDDAPIMFMDTLRYARYVQVRLTGTVTVQPTLSVVYAGVMLAMTQEVEGNGFTPITLSRDTILQTSMSKGGQFLAQGFRRNGVKGSVGFKYLDQYWYRSTFDPFVKAARNLPFFFAWWPDTMPTEVAFVWTDQDIIPKYMGLRDLMQVSWNMQGIGTP